MAYTQGDIKRWRMDAEDAGGDLAAQLVWLKGKRAEYAPKIASGDWAMTSDSTEGASSTGTRGISDRDNHDAIVAAIEQVKVALGQSVNARGALLGFRIKSITG